MTYSGIDTLEGQEAFVIDLAAEVPMDEIGVTQERWWVSTESVLPFQFEEYDVNGEFIRRIIIRDLKLDQNLTEKDFGI
jgi:outer membrane lipoprotein-sorting protein